MPRRKIVIDGKKPFKPIRLMLNRDSAVASLRAIASDTVRGAIREINTGGRLGNVRPDGARASVIGEAPYTYTGELISSFRVQEVSIVPPVVHIASTVAHARDHEFGGRPFLSPEFPKAVLMNPVIFKWTVTAK